MLLSMEELIQARASVIIQLLATFNPLDIAPGNPQDLIAMPAMILSVPEPSTFALVGLAAC